MSQHKDSADSTGDPGRNADGTFKKGSEAAKDAGHKGGLHSHDNDGLAKDEKVSEMEVQSDVSTHCSVYIVDRTATLTFRRTTPVATQMALSRRVRGRRRRQGTRGGLLLESLMCWRRRGAESDHYYTM